MKKIIILSLSTVFLAGAFAVAAPASAVTLQELQNQIQSLLGQVKQLQTQNQNAAAIDAVADIAAGTSESATANQCFNFKQNLRRTDTGRQATNLHVALQKEGYAIDKGEINNKRFGDSTKSAVISFQEKYKNEILVPINETRGTGFVGNTTRAKLNQLYGCATIPRPPITSPSITVVSPNGGEKWREGSMQIIKWSAISSVKYVNILFGDYDNQNVDDQGHPYIMFNSIVNNTPNDGSYEWNVGTSYDGIDLVPYSSRYIILIQNSDTYIGDQSDKPFSIVEARTGKRLTQTQIDAISALLKSFGVNQSVIDNVKAALDGR